MAIKQLDLLRTKRFWPLFVTQFLGAFNDNVYKNALVMLITYQTLYQIAGINSQILVTIAAGIFILPFFLFSATAGQLADKFEKSRLICIIKLAEIVIMLLATIGFYLKNIYWLMSVLFLLGAQASFFGPLKYAILPIQLHENELIAGNGLIEAGTFVAILLGTILGGILIILPNGIIMVSLMICLISLLGFWASLYIQNTQIENVNLTISFNFISQTIHILKYSKENPTIFICIMGISWFWLVGAVFLAEFPVFVKDILHAHETVVIYFFSLFTIGIALGSLLCNRLLQGKIRATFVPLGALGISLFSFDLYFSANYFHPISDVYLISFKKFMSYFSGWRISADILLMSISGGLYTVPLYAILQQQSQAFHRARVIASNNIMNAFFMVMAAFVSVLLLYLGLTVNEIFLTIAIINMFVVIYLIKAAFI